MCPAAVRDRGIPIPPGLRIGGVGVESRQSMATQWQVGAPRSHAVFVGRRQELRALEEALADARAGRPRVVAVAGPAGIGKTALVEQFLADAGEVIALRASGDESERELEFGVVDQLLRRAGEARPDGDHLTAGARILELLGTLENERPGVVLIDDAHWADMPSLRALLFVVRRLVADPVLVVIVTREDASMLPEGLRKACDAELWLRPLKADE